MGEQAGPDAALRDRLGRQDRLGDLRVVALRLARPAGIGGADQFADEDRHRLVIEAFAGALADADLDRAAARTDLLGVAQVDLFPATRQVLRLAPPTVALPLRRGRRFGGRRFDRRRDLGFGHGHPVEEGRAFDPLAAAAERDLHEAVDVGLLRFDLLAKFGHHAAEFRDHGVRVGQLLAKVVRVVGRRHAGFNTAPRSG